MGAAIGAVIPFAVGVAISPMPIVAVISLLFAPSARSNGSAFAAGWILALLVISGIASAASDAGDVASNKTPSELAYAVKVLLGMLLLLLAVRLWRRRPRASEEAHMPKWTQAIESFSPAKSFGLAALLGGVNPKNLAMAVAAAVSIGQGGLSGTESLLVLVVFVLLGSVSVAGPVFYYLLAEASAGRALNSLRSWLIANNATVMVVLFLVLGAVLFGQGFGGVVN
jgi:hypothetical protein